MGSLGILLRKSDSERRAADALEEAEDKLMAVHPMESEDLSFHCSAEAERAIVFIKRIRNLQAIFTTRSDRNLYATLILGAALLMKGTITFEDLGHAGAALLKLLGLT